MKDKELGALKRPGMSEPFVKFLLREDNILVMKWKGFVSGDSIKEAHTQVLEHLKKNQVTGLVEDVVDFTGPFHEVNTWFVQVWVPAALKNGLSKAAVIMSKSVFTQLSVNDLKENADFKKLGLGYRIFDRINPAAEWILAKELVS
jgi:hypothetical protein